MQILAPAHTYTYAIEMRVKESRAPDPPDIVERSWEIHGFRSQGEGPAGRPQGV